MSSAAKVGEIFTKAGESYNKLGEMIMLLHPTGQELTALERAVAKQVHSKKSWGAGGFNGINFFSPLFSPFFEITY